nr:WD40 repeat domain-containing protein [Myxococcus sp. MH1]
METLACGHAAPVAGLCCVHLLENEDAGYYVRFTGRGAWMDLLCEDCGRVSHPGQAHRAVCTDCQQATVARGFDLIGVIGRPESRSRATDLRFEHREHSLSALTGRTPLAVAALGASSWLAVDPEGALLRLDLDEAPPARLGSVSDTALDLAAPLALHVSACARFAAVVNLRGSHGVVVDLTTGAVTMRLDRGSYHTKHCDYSVAFFRDGDRTLLVHATGWNRLDLSDPASGALLSAREPPSRGEPNQPIRAHELDYFHCGLTVSPNDEWLVDDGWVWHPVGILTSLSLRRWVRENVWESEDGPSQRRLREVPYYWDGPRCFVGPRILATWGFGGDVDKLIDAALFHDVSTGKLLRWFPGPRGAFECDGNLLLASAADTGTAVWDIETGEKLHEDATLKPTAWHPVARRFLTVLPQGGLRESSLSGTAW